MRSSARSSSKRERRASVAGEIEYAFRHVLVRDVAYGQIPRGLRAEKHRVAARWIESLGRPEDHAEMLAHHYLQALELSRAAGQSVDDIAGPARDALREAGDRAASLNSFEPALRFYDEALALGIPDAAEKALVQFERAKAVHLTGRDESEGSLKDARDALLSAGDLERAAEADALLADVWWFRGSRDRSLQHLERAHELVAGLTASAGKARVLSQVARYRMLAQENEESIRIGAEALSLADELGLDELRAHVLDSIGPARVALGDLAGIEDVERGIEIAVAARSPEATRGYNNLGAMAWGLGDLRRARTLFDAAVVAGEKLGGASIDYSRTIQTELLFRSGDWGEGLRRADAFLAACDAGESSYRESQLRLRRAAARWARGDVEGALEDLQKTMQPARAAGDPQALVTSLVSAARLNVVLGRVDEGRELAHEALAGKPVMWALTDLAWVAAELDCEAAVREWIEQIPIDTKWRGAARALLQHDFVTAADVFSDSGALDDEALARLRAAEQLVAEGRRGEADEQLQRSLAFWRSVDATRYIQEGEALLAHSA